MSKYIISYQGRQVNRIEAEFMEVNKETGQTILSDMNNKPLATIPVDHVVIQIPCNND